jgi:hypothetical protein
VGLPVQPGNPGKIEERGFIVGPKISVRGEDRNLETEPQRHLYVSRPSASEVRVLCADIGSDGDRQKTNAAACRVDPVGGPVHHIIRIEWIRKIRVIEDVEDVDSQLHA